MSDAAAAFSSLHALAEHIRSHGVQVQHVQRKAATVDAVYRSPIQGGPVIETFRKDVNAPDDPWREVALLAHEFGHHVSDLNGWRSPRYFAANQRMADGCLHLEDEEIVLVLQEECIAWRVARIVLEGLGIDVPDFEEIKRSKLRAYCRWMFVSDDWAEAIDAHVAALGSSAVSEA
jgi:hypothetical protein